MKIKGAIFDMDGTLLDSMHIWEHVASNYIRGLGMDPPADLEETVSTMTMLECAAYMKERFSLPETPEALYADITQNILRFYQQDAQPKKHVLTFLKSLQKQGVSMCVATATDRQMSQAALERTGLWPFFQFMITSKEAGAGKQFPDLFNQCLDRLGTPRKETAVFEDALHAIVTAKEAGFPVIAVRDVYAQMDRAKIEALADETVTFLTESTVYVK